MSVLVRSEGLKRRSVRPAEVRVRAERMLRALDLDDAELSILLCDDEAIHALNRAYRRQDRPTDVLAFAMREGDGPLVRPEVLGDVVISLETARRQASARGVAIVAEVTFLMAHGLLHLLGYDHQTDEEERRMSARTDALVAAASVRRSSRDAT